LLGWRLDEYNSEQIIPFYIQNALTEQLRQTEVARAWKQCQIDAVHGDYIVSQSLRVLTSKNEKVSYKVRLIPGLI
ncbi:J domain-containing protein, partial [Klebsiella pneumoniae]|nr:J domain-containing protein [Klebsiella pneumoniae]